MAAFKIFLGRKLIDTIFMADTAKGTRWDPEDIKRSLINHDGYDPGIRVVKERGPYKPRRKISKPDTEKTDVIFRAVKSGDFKGDIEAFFPAIPETPDQPHKTICCYAHVGQHGAASMDYYRDYTRPALPAGSVFSFHYVLPPGQPRLNHKRFLPIGFLRLEIS